jgi:ABC-2 type transport system permease protein
MVDRTKSRAFERRGGRDRLRLYFSLTGAQYRSQMQYRGSFLLDLAANVVITALDFLAVFLVMVRFRTMAGWSLSEVIFLYGSSAVSFSTAEFFCGAFAGFDRWVVRGEFDRFLIRPLPIVFQMLSGEVQLRRVGRILQGTAALVLALVLLRPAWGIGDCLFFCVMLLSGFALFLAIFITGATISFWTPQTSELTNILTYGGQFMTSYPMNIYQVWMRSIFTFLIPMAFVNFYPAVRLLGKPDPFGLPPWIPFASPLIAAGALSIALAFWTTGVRHYQSTGS